jgi:uncharacterized protein (DUF1810 family)
VPSAPAEGGALFAKFLDAQNAVYSQALGELRAGRKTSHWMWFVFPQLAGLGSSEMARNHALASLEEAGLYASHPVLGARLAECTQAVLLHAPEAAAPRSLGDIFGAPDDMKFISSMTLFALAVPEDPLFRQALDAFNGGREDQRTLALLKTH